MKLKFRSMMREDQETIMNWRTDPEVSKYMYTDFVPSIETQYRWFESVRNDPTRRDWVINVDDEDVGLLSIVKIDQKNKRCEWAYYLASPSIRGKGVGKNVELNVHFYVFETLGLNKLSCEVFTFNDLVIKIHEKYGSKIEGTRRQHVEKNGNYHDIVEMAILKDDWENKICDKFSIVRANFEE